jgi:hypothetical protein
MRIAGIQVRARRRQLLDGRRVAAMCRGMQAGVRGGVGGGRCDLREDWRERQAARHQGEGQASQGQASVHAAILACSLCTIAP